MKGLRPIMVYSFAAQIEITPEGDTMISSLGEAELHFFISSFSLRFPAGSGPSAPGIPPGR